MTSSTATNPAAHAFDAAAGNAAVAALVAERRAFIVPMAITCFVAYIGTTVLAGFAKEFIAIKLVGAVNVGFTLIALNYVLAWALAIAYVRIANSRFDPLAELAVAVMTRSPEAR